MINNRHDHKGRLQLFPGLKEKGWRVSELMILVENGSADTIAGKIFMQNKTIGAVTIRIDSIANVIAEIYYRETEELNDVMQKIKSMKDVQNIIFSEIVSISNNRSIEGITKKSRR